MNEKYLLAPEQINDCYDKARARWERDGKTDIYEFSFLWQYIADEIAKAQLAYAEPLIRANERKRILNKPKSEYPANTTWQC